MRSRAILVAFATLCLALVLAIGDAGASTPRRPPGAPYFGPGVIWTDGTTTDTFVPLSGAMAAAPLTNVRIYYEVTEATGGTNLRSRPALRYSADGVDWDATTTALNVTFVQGSGIQTGNSGFVDLSTLGTPKAYVQFGVQLHNNTQGSYEIANAVLIVQPKGN